MHRNAAERSVVIAVQCGAVGGDISASLSFCLRRTSVVVYLREVVIIISIDRRVSCGPLACWMSIAACITHASYQSSGSLSTLLLYSCVGPYSHQITSKFT